MATEQPVAGDKLNSPDHSLMHRQIAADSSAPVKSIDIDADGAIQGGTPLFQNINPTNLISNGDFESWSAGTAVAPDGWTAQGAGASVAREGTIFKLGTYSSAFTRGGTNCSFYQDVASTRGITYFRGRNITFGMWVYATVAARTKLIVIDNGGSSASSFHTGGSSWEFLTVTHTVDAAATGTLIARADIEAGDTTCYYDGAMLVEGSSAFAFSPKPIVYPGAANQGDILFDGGTDIERLTPGTSGDVLITEGASKNPRWGSVGSISIQTFTSSGTWTKPSSGTMALIQAWGAGGGGGSGTPDGGGGGGGYIETWIDIGDLGATETVTIGAGGTVSWGGGGGDGGTTTFGSHASGYGGGGGGDGGSVYSTAGGVAEGAGGDKNPPTVPINIYGGGGSCNTNNVNVAGSKALYGGGGGGSDGGAGGVSTYGGNGGASGNPGTAGTQPGGGGGAGAGDTYGAIGGAGQCIVTVF